MNLKKSILAISVFCLSLSVLGAEQEGELHEGPCNKIQEACKAYVKTSKEKISLYRDCMQPLLNGQKIENLKIEADVLKACQLKKAEIKQKK